GQRAEGMSVARSTWAMQEKLNSIRALIRPAERPHGAAHDFVWSFVGVDHDLGHLAGADRDHVEVLPPGVVEEGRIGERRVESGATFADPAFLDDARRQNLN